MILGFHEEVTRNAMPSITVSATVAAAAVSRVRRCVNRKPPDWSSATSHSETSDSGASEEKVIQQYDVAKGTVRRAVALLREQSWVVTVERRGSYVFPLGPAEG